MRLFYLFICLPLVLLTSLSSRPLIASDKVAAKYQALRQQMLNTKPNSLGLNPKSKEVWGVIIEADYLNTIGTLVVFANGTVSLYLGGGGGIVGLGTHAGPKKAAQHLLSLAQNYAKYAAPSHKFHLPKLANIKFYFLTGRGVSSIEVNKRVLLENRHKISPLYYQGFALVSEIRRIYRRYIAK